MKATAAVATAATLLVLLASTEGFAPPTAAGPGSATLTARRPLVSISTSTSTSATALAASTLSASDLLEDYVNHRFNAKRARKVTPKPLAAATGGATLAPPSASFGVSTVQQRQQQQQAQTPPAAAGAASSAEAGVVANVVPFSRTLSEPEAMHSPPPAAALQQQQPAQDLSLDPQTAALQRELLELRSYVKHYVERAGQERAVLVAKVETEKARADTASAELAAVRAAFTQYTTRALEAKAAAAAAERARKKQVAAATPTLVQ